MRAIDLRAIFLRFLCFVIVFAGTVTVSSIALAKRKSQNQDSANTYVIDGTQKQQTFEGWGMSLAWFGNIIYPGNGAVTDWEHWNSVVADYYGPTGLGFTIARYNIGGGENPAYQYLFAKNAKFKNPAYMIEGFRDINGNYNWDADKPQVLLLQKAQELGANIFEAFSNSPPYYWTKSQSVTGAEYVSDGRGGETGAYDNLLDSKYDDFADYLTEVVKHFQTHFGINFRTLEPVNEPRPETRYWTFRQDFPNGKVQEGCHFSIQNQNKIQLATARSLNAKGLSTVLSGSDDTGIDYTLSSLQKSDQTLLTYDVKQINTHSYIGGDRASLKALASKLGVRLWMSEFDTDGTEDLGISGALRFADEIRLDLNDLGAQAWIIWQPDWGLEQLPGNNRVIYNKEYFAMMQFTKYIRPGSIILRNSDSSSVSAYDPSTRRLAIVTVNTSYNSELMMANFTGFTNMDSRAHVYATSSSQNMKDLGTLNIQEDVLEYTVDPASITTLLIENVDL